jgi:hypothetical protein
MKTKNHAQDKKNDLASRADRALKRAARQARQVARRFGTPVYYTRKGKIVSEKP